MTRTSGQKASSSSDSPRCSPPSTSATGPRAALLRQPRHRLLGRQRGAPLELGARGGANRVHAVLEGLGQALGHRHARPATASPFDRQLLGRLGSAKVAGSERMQPGEAEVGHHPGHRPEVVRGSRLVEDDGQAVAARHMPPEFSFPDPARCIGIFPADASLGSLRLLVSLVTLDRLWRGGVPCALR